MSVELSGAHRFSNVIGQAVQTPVQAHILGRVLFSVYSSGSGRVAAALPKTHSVCKSNRGGFLIMQTTCTALREMCADGALFKTIPTAQLRPEGATFIETPFSAQVRSIRKLDDHAKNVSQCCNKGKNAIIMILAQCDTLSLSQSITLRCQICMGNASRR